MNAALREYTTTLTQPTDSLLNKWLLKNTHLIATTYKKSCRKYINVLHFIESCTFCACLAVITFYKLCYFYLLVAVLKASAKQRYQTSLAAAQRFR